VGKHITQRLDLLVNAASNKPTAFSSGSAEGAREFFDEVRDVQTASKTASVASLAPAIPRGEKLSNGVKATDKIAFAQIEPVGQCNLRCQMCPIQFRQDGPPHGPLAFMEFDTYRRLIDQMPGLRTLHLQGMGEPLMHPRFFEMVRYAADRGIAVSTNTNLTLLSARRSRLCVDSGLVELHASLDGATAQTYERIRVRASFEKARRHLEQLLRVRAELGVSHPRVHVVVVVMRDNLHELPALVELAHAMGIEDIFVQHLCHDYAEAALPAHYRPMRDFVEAQTLLRDDPARVRRYFDTARDRAHALGVQLRLPRIEMRAVRKRGCDWPRRGPYISYKGEAMPCCMVGTPDRVNLGDVAKHGVDAVWHGPAYTEFRAALDSDTPPDICRSCAVYQGVF
jgi:MoaA/NifB/PqqE/SkfB family radical SAM enzyme